MRWSSVFGLATACVVAFATLVYGWIPAMPRNDDRDWRQRELAFLKAVHDRIQAEIAGPSTAAESLRREHRSIVQAMADVAKLMPPDRVPNNIKMLLTTSEFSKGGKEDAVAPQIESVAPTTSVGSTDAGQGSDDRISTEVNAPAATVSPPSVRAPAGPVVFAARPTNQPLRVEPVTQRTLAQLEEALNAEKTDRGLRVRLPANVLSGTAGDTLDPSADQNLSSVIELITAMRPREIVVAGHTDASTKRDADIALSKERARAVSNWLKAHGLGDRPRLVAQGYGGTRPLAENTNADGTDNPEGREQNRRIEILLRRR